MIELASAISCESNDNWDRAINCKCVVYLTDFPSFLPIAVRIWEWPHIRNKSTQLNIQHMDGWMYYLSSNFCIHAVSPPLKSKGFINVFFFSRKGVQLWKDHFVCSSLCFIFMIWPIFLTSGNKYAEKFHYLYLLKKSRLDFIFWNKKLRNQHHFHTEN